MIINLKLIAGIVQNWIFQTIDCFRNLYSVAFPYLIYYFVF